MLISTLFCSCYLLKLPLALKKIFFLPGTKRNLRSITIEVKKNKLPWRYVVRIQKKEVIKIIISR